MPEPRQIPLELDLQPQLDRDSFIASPSNRAALDMIESWPEWPTRTIILFGPPGAGKSHLANIWMSACGAVAAVPGRPVDQVGAAGLYVENIDRGPIDEPSLFHLINSVSESEQFLLITAQSPITDWKLTLPDLVSRLRMATPVHLDAPDDELLRQVLVKLFADRQLHVDKPVIDYMLLRMERSLSAARTIVDDVDRLALAENRRITRFLVADALDRRDGGNAEHEN